jgi:hypothetical protein
LGQQVRAEEGNHLPVEFDMEGRAIEAFGIGADLNNSPRLGRGAWRQESEVPGIGHCVQFWPGDEVVPDGCGVIVGDAIAAEFRGPQLDRHVHIFQSLGREDAAKQRIGDHSCPNARIVHHRLCRNFVQAGFGAARLHRAFRTPSRKNIPKIHLAADQGEAGKPPREKPKKPMRSQSIFAALGQAPSMQSIKCLISARARGPCDRVRAIGRYRLDD